MQIKKNYIVKILNEKPTHNNKILKISKSIRNKLHSEMFCLSNLDKIRSIVLYYYVEIKK